MKNIIRSLIVVVLFITSCSDPCEDIICLNGGICIDGTCDCPEGWTGIDCGTFDFDYVGRFSISTVTHSGCNVISNNMVSSANSDFEFCVVIDEVESCIGVTLVFEDGNQAMYISISVLRNLIDGVVDIEQTSFPGTYTTNNELVTFTFNDGTGDIPLTVNDDRTGLLRTITFVTGGCMRTEEFIRE